MKQPIVYELQAGKLLALSGMRGRELSVQQGQVWITEDAYLQDAVISAGSCYCGHGGRHVLIEALAPTRISIEAQSSAVSDLAAWFTEAWHAIKARGQLGDGDPLAQSVPCRYKS